MVRQGLAAEMAYVSAGVDSPVNSLPFFLREYLREGRRCSHSLSGVSGGIIHGINLRLVALGVGHNKNPRLFRTGAIQKLVCPLNPRSGPTSAAGLLTSGSSSSSAFPPFIGPGSGCQEACWKAPQLQ